jgi:hypothetical protein
MRLSIVLLLVSLASSPAWAKQDLVKDPKSGKTLAIIVDCNSCKDANGKDCGSGAEEGFHDGADCGKCLLESNFGTRIGYPYDLHIVGRLQDEEGKALGSRFVQISLPNTWRIRTRTQEDGSFRLMLGATLPKESNEKMTVVDLGTRSTRNSSGTYALFMMQEGYKPCQKKEE